MAASNACTVLPFAVGGNQLLLQLNGPGAWAAAGGCNVATLSNAAGDLRLLASNAGGLTVQALTGNVGVGKTAPAFALDVSGGLSAAALFGCITDATTTSNSALAASAAGLSNVAVVAAAALPRAGGTVSGGLTVAGTLVASNVSVLGTTETVNAYTTASSNVVVANQGTGPALVVSQTETGPFGAQPTALFLAGSNVALYVAAAGGVGVGQCNATAGYALDVSGAVRVTGSVGIGTTVPRARLDVNDTGAIVIPSGTTLQQPSVPVLGMMRLNTDTNHLQYYGTSGWQSVGGVIALGGTVTTVNGFRIHVFTSSGTWTVTLGGSINYLVIAGGGGGAAQASSNNRAGGGGGAGGMLAGTTTVSPGTYTITVGNGGNAAANSYYAVGTSGGNSSLGSLVVATGGGNGGSGTTSAGSGGSGGGGGSGDPGTGGGAGIAGQGYGGGGGLSTGSSSGGGGGGAGGAGTPAINTYAATAAGGAGMASSITGTSVTYARGGDSSWFASTSFQPRANCGDGGPAGGVGGGAADLPMAGASGCVIVAYSV